MPLSLPYPAAGLSALDAAAFALDRLGFGPRPGQAARVARDLEGWLDEQFRPSLPDPDLERRLGEIRAWGLSLPETVRLYKQPSAVLREAIADGELPAGAVQRDPAVRRAVHARMDRLGLRSYAALRRELVEAKLTRALAARHQLRETLADLWYNHFNVYGAGVQIVPVPGYDAALRRGALGRFRDLLGMTARHPAMLIYLTNDGSHVPPDGTALWGRPPRRGGVNENYARELLELHTLGVDGGYTLRDIQEVARAFTGRGTVPFRGSPEGLARQRAAVERIQSRGAPVVQDAEGFLFRPNWHDAGAKTVLGRTLPAGRGMQDGEDVLDLLAAHPSTARHIAHTLAVRYVADDPDPRLVGRLADVFQRTAGDVLAVMRALVQDPAFWAAATAGPDGARSKVKTPFEYVVSALRATGADVRGTRGLTPMLKALGEPLYHAEAPTGFPDHAEAWVNAGLLLGRMDFALRLARGEVRQVRVDPYALTGGRQPESAEAALAEFAAALLPGRDLASTLDLLAPIVREPSFAERVGAAARAEPADGGRLDDGGAFADDRTPAQQAEDTAQFVVGVVLGAPAFQRQ